MFMHAHVASSQLIMAPTYRHAPGGGSACACMCTHAHPHIHIYICIHMHTCVYRDAISRGVASDDAATSTYACICIHMYTCVYRDAISRGVASDDAATMAYDAGLCACVLLGMLELVGVSHVSLVRRVE